MLHLDQLRLSLGERHWHFDAILATHSVTALLGRSGSGKSTLLNLIAGFQQPDAGDLRWHDDSLLPMPPARRPVTSLFQQHNLFDHLTVRQNIGLALHPGLRLNSAQIDAVQSAIDDVGLSGQESNTPKTLSGGEQQRVALARCMLMRRPILLLDEPFSALDARTRAEMIDLLKQLIGKHQLCVLMVTHEERDAQALSATCLELSDGQLRSG